MPKNLFNAIQVKRPNRNFFDLSHDVKMSGKMGNLNPTLVLPCVPGDKFNLGCESLLRFAPLISPVMHRMDVTMHYFFVPNRILWPKSNTSEGWENFITNPQTNIDAPFITIPATGITAEQRYFLTAMGLPKTADWDYPVNALPFAAYNKIYNDYYRDQNLVNEIKADLEDGENLFAEFIPSKGFQQRAWEHDYFTSALPSSQKGVQVDIPLGDVTLVDPVSGQSGKMRTAGSYAPGAAGALSLEGGTGDVQDNANTDLVYDPNGTLEVQPTTINDLRRAFKLQEWLELAMRAGQRYVENIQAFFGIRPQDSRLQRAEYITGIKTPVVVSEVLNTTGEAGTGGLPQGNMAGHAIAVTGGKYGYYRCQEHGYIIGIMSVMPKTAYYQGVPKDYQKFDPLDYFWPQFAHIGEQEVKRSELYADQSTWNQTWGYVPRYAEYKYMPSRVAGNFVDTLEFWHLARKFDTAPVLGQEFIEMQPNEGNRIFAVDNDDDNLYCHIYHRIKAIRPMPKFGNPTL